MVQISDHVIAKMAFSPKEERIVCPVCGRRKMPAHLVCHECNKVPANTSAVKKALNFIKTHPSQEIWAELLVAVEEVSWNEEKEEKAFAAFRTKFSEGKLSFLPKETVIRAIQVARGRRERLQAAAKFLRQYLENGGEFSSVPVHLASNAIRDAKDGGEFTHPLLTVASDKLIIPEETKKALERIRKEQVEKKLSKTLQGMARFTASRQTRAKTRQRRGNSSVVPAIA